MAGQNNQDLAHTPAAPAPEGQTTNFVDPPSQEIAMIAISTVMIVLTLLFVSVRLFTSLRITLLSGLEDWLCAVAMALSFGYIGVILRLAFVSRHMWDVPVIWFTENYWKIRFAGNTLQALAYFTSRMPVLLLYIRLFGTANPKLQIACYVAMVAAFGAYVTSIPLISYFCTPSPGGDWNSLDVFDKCKKLLDWAMIQGSLDVVLNVYIFILPLPILFKLQMPPKRKLGVLAIFLTGLLAVISSAVGLYFRYQLSFTPDVNWNEGAFICMSVVEINVAIICSCMPACASFSKHMVKHSGFLVSLRSAFMSSGPSKGGSSGNGKFPSPPGSESDRGRWVCLPENSQVELRDAGSGKGWTASIGHHSAHAESVSESYVKTNRPCQPPAAIFKTVAVDVV